MNTYSTTDMTTDMTTTINNAIIPTGVAIFLNIILSKLLSNFASKKEIKPSKGAASLSFKGQFMHMMVHHEQVLFMSSFIVGLVVFLSVVIAENTKMIEY